MLWNSGAGERYRLVRDIRPVPGGQQRHRTGAVLQARLPGEEQERGNKILSPPCSSVHHTGFKTSNTLRPYSNFSISLLNLYKGSARICFTVNFGILEVWNYFLLYDVKSSPSCNLFTNVFMYYFYTLGIYFLLGRERLPAVRLSGSRLSSRACPGENLLI